MILMFGDHQPSMDEGVSEFMDQKLEERDGELDSPEVVLRQLYPLGEF